MARHEEAVRELGALRQADAAARADLERGPRARRLQPERAGERVRAVVPKRDRQRLREPARAAQQVAAAAPRAVREHARLALERLERAQEHRRRAARGLAHQVRAHVDAHRHVHVEVSGRAEHGAVAPRLATVRVRAGIAAVAQVGLDLDDPPGQARAAGQLAHQRQAQEVRRDLERRAREEGARQPHAQPSASSDTRETAAASIPAQSKRIGWSRSSVQAST